jgi:hypothetical protein
VDLGRDSDRDVTGNWLPYVLRVLERNWQPVSEIA